MVSDRYLLIRVVRLFMPCAGGTAIVTSFSTRCWLTSPCRPAHPERLSIVAGLRIRADDSETARFADERGLGGW